jgi:hypothetical protein
MFEDDGVTGLFIERSQVDRVDLEEDLMQGACRLARPIFNIPSEWKRPAREVRLSYLTGRALVVD